MSANNDLLRRRKLFLGYATHFEEETVKNILNG